MKTMQDYSTFCTPEQTKRAYKLGAPIDKEAGAGYQYEELRNPTAEQMVGWIREKYRLNLLVGPICKMIEPVSISFLPPCRREITGYGWCVDKVVSPVQDRGKCDTYEQAIHAAIDTALSYLEKGGNNGKY